MSTLQTTILKHPDSASNNIQFDSSGNSTFASQAKALNFRVNTTGGVQAGALASGEWFTTSAGADADIVFGAAGNNFYFHNASTSTDLVKVDSSGTVIIGRTTSSDPNRYIQIHNATAASSAYLQSTNTGTGSGAADGIVMGMGDATNAYFWNYEAGEIIFATDASQKAAIDSSGRLLVGTTSARSTFYGATSIRPQFQIESAGLVDDNRMMSIVSNPGDTGGYAATILLGRSRSEVANGVGALGEGDPLGQISFQGGDSARLLEGANIAAFCDAAVQAAGEMPGRLVFSTTPDGSGSPSQRWEIDNAGALKTITPPPVLQDSLHLLGSYRNIKFGNTFKIFYVNAGSGTGVFDTGITVNQGNAGATMLLFANCNTSNGTATASAIYAIQFYYDGNNTPTKGLLSTSSNVLDDFVAVGQSASNTLTLQSVLNSNWSFACLFLQ